MYLDGSSSVTSIDIRTTSRETRSAACSIQFMSPIFRFCLPLNRASRLRGQIGGRSAVSASPSLHYNIYYLLYSMPNKSDNDMTVMYKGPWKSEQDAQQKQHSDATAVLNGMDTCQRCTHKTPCAGPKRGPTNSQEMDSKRTSSRAHTERQCFQGDLMTSRLMCPS